MKILNKKGFTLVELLAVIVILSIIAIIAYPIIGNTINNSKKKLQKEQYNRIKSAAKNWTTTNSIDDLNGECVSVNKLKSEGFLEDGKIEDPLNGSDMNGSFKITWNSSTNQYYYLYWGNQTCDGGGNPYTTYD